MSVATRVRNTYVTVRFLFRWFSGLELDGHRRTDATWKFHGTKTVHSTGYAWRWHYWPLWHRACWRAGATFGPLALAIALLLDTELTLAVLGAAALIGLIFGIARFHHWCRTHGDRDRARIIANAAAGHLNTRPAAKPHQWVYRADGGGNGWVLKLPANYHHSETKEKTLAKLVAKNALMSDGHDYEYVPDRRPRLIVREMSVPPESVDLARALDALDRAGAGHYFLGLGVDCKEMWVDLNRQAPHIAWSCGTGAGKTIAGRNLAAQIRREGGRVAILDFAKEGESHGDWVYNEDGEVYPGIEFYDKVAAAHDALVALGEERSRRSTAAKEARRFRRPEPVFQRVLVIIEEMNTGTRELNAYWKRIRSREDPLESPAITAYRDLVCKGRSTLMNVLAVAQRFDAAVTAGGDVRANFGARMLARFDEQARRMLIPEIAPKPVSSSHPGRAILCIDGEAQAVQGVFLTVEQTRERAFGHPNEASYRYEPLVSEVSEVPTDVVVPCSEQAEQADQGYDSEDIGHGPVAVIEPAVDTVTLSEAIEQGVVTGTKAALQRASTRPGFPTPRVKGTPGRPNRYAKADLMLWELDRRSAPADLDADSA